VRFLGFARTRARSGAGRSANVRPSRFEARSSLPTSAACVVANGVRETLSSLLGFPVAMRLFEPSIPEPDAWPAILRNAKLCRVRGSVTDAVVVLRPADAIALAAGVFGEPQGATLGERALSAIECEIVDRAAGAIAANLSPVCGSREAHCVERVGAIDGFVSYFELLIEEPVEARIGIALSRDPLPEARGRLEVGHLAGVRIMARVSLDLGKVEAGAVARLAAGAVVPIRLGDLRRCSLTVAGQRLARGTCGVIHGRYALAVDAIREAI
jgi:hypothetical protein